jgi:hypothetical protein
MREQLAWCAGFFDGEGTCGFYKHRNRGQLQLVVGQIHEAPLQRLKSALGVGNINGPYSYKNRRPISFFRVGKPDEFLTVMSALWPWLSRPKKDQFKAAVAAWRNN